MIKNKKKGFTLAEVLTTLMVIGIVAALTIPNLMNSYKERQTVTKLKKTYAELSQAIKLVPLSQGCTNGDFECINWKNLTQEEKTNLFIKQLSGSRLLPDSEIVSPELAQGKTFLTTNNTKITMVSYINEFQNGITEFYVDINGNKSPNKPGADIFYFFFSSDEVNNVEAGTLIPVGSALEAKYYNEPEIHWKKNPSYCSTGEEYSACAGRILEEGKISYKVK